MATKRSRQGVTGQSSCCEGEFIDTLCRLGEVLLAFSSGVLTMVTFGTPYWMVREPATSNSMDETAYHLGLWQNCTVMGSSICKGLPLHGDSVPSYLMITRLFMSLALGAGLVSWVICVLGLMRHKSLWLFLSAIAYTIQGFSLMLGLSSFSRAYHNTKDAHASWSYTLGWIAFLFSLVCATYFILTAVWRMRKPQSSKSSPQGMQQNNSYTPLAQFEESSDSSSEGDEKL